MTAHEQFYSFEHGVIIDQNGVCFQELNKPIQFYDNEYNVTGEIIWQNMDLNIHVEYDEKKEDREDEKEDKKKEEIVDKKKDKKEDEKENKIVVDVEPKRNQTQFPQIVITHIGHTCRSPIDYVQHIIQYQNENQVIQISGEQFVTFRKYINLNKEFYVPEHVKLIGNSTKNPNNFFPPNHVIHFNDKRFNIKGSISWTHKDEGVIFMSPSTHTSGQDLSLYVNQILKHMEQTGGHLILYNMEKSKNGDTVNIMYDGISEPIEILEKRYIHTLFHEQIGALWNMIKMINYHPEEYRNMGQSPRINLLLYGPPGTGKSTFAYRVAMATRRHIVNVKISKYSRAELMNVFIKPQIKMTTYHPQDIIYVLDEFDKDIERLLLRQSGKKQQLDLVDEVITKTMKSWIPIKDGKVTGDSIEVNTESSASQPPKKHVKVDQLQQTIKDMDNLVEGMTRAYDKINNMDDDVVGLHDLLTIFQGAVPIEGTIILAMTNKYSYLHEKCPQLFRPGRLTPVYFGNFDKTMLDYVSKYYFNRNVTDPSLSDVINLQPSAVIDAVIKSTLEISDIDGQYQQFLRHLRIFCQKSQ